MSKWKKHKLSTLSHTITKGTTPTSIGGKFTKSGINYIKAEAVTLDGQIDPTKFAFIDSQTNEKLKRSKLEDGDIMFSMAGIVLGKTAIIEKKHLPANTNQALALIRLKKNIANPTFVHYYFRQKNVFEYVNSITAQSAQPNINLAEIGDLEIPLPDLSTQSRIASMLSSLDDKIELNRRMNQTLERMAQALFNHYFVDNIDPDNLPEGWRWGKLGEMVNVKGGTTPSTKEPKFWNGNIHWTSPRDLSSLSFPVLLDTEKKITEEGLKKISSGLLPIGTLLLSSRAPIGYLAITEIPVAINQGYIAIDCSKGYSNLFMLYWLKTNMNILIQNANGSTFLEVSKSVFRNIDVIIPSLKKVEKYDGLVSSMFAMIVSNEKENKTLSKIRDTLLPKLMSGEIDEKALMKKEEQSIENLKTA